MTAETAHSETNPVQQDGKTAASDSAPNTLTPLRLGVDPTAGAAVIETDANGAPTGRNFVSFAWTTRLRAGTGGCPQWVDMIVVGDTATAAQKGKSLIPTDNPIASSSVSSRDVLFIHVDASGQRDNAFVSPNLVAAVTVDPPVPEGFPIAKTFWFSNDTFTPAVLSGIEAKCHN